MNFMRTLSILGALLLASTAFVGCGDPGVGEGGPPPEDSTQSDNAPD